MTRIIIYPTNPLSKKVEINLTNLNIKTKTVQTSPVWNKGLPNRMETFAERHLKRNKGEQI